MIPVYSYLVIALAILWVRISERRGRGLGEGAVVVALALIAASAMIPKLVFAHDMYLHDVWVNLEQANKARGGLLSSVDYANLIGPVYDRVLWVAATLRPISATTIPLANALFAAVVLVFAVLILRRQVSAPVLGLTVLLAVATTVSPRETDTIFATAGSSWLAPYNRWGFGLAVPLAVALGCRDAGRVYGRGWQEAVAIGVALALLLMLKVTYGAALVLLLVISVALGLTRVVHAALAVVCLVVTVGLFELATGQVSANLEDIRAAAVLRDTGLRPTDFVPQMGEASIWMLLAAGAYVLLKGIDREDPAPRALIMVLVVGIMGCGILMQNHAKSESAIYATLPIIVAAWLGLFGQRRMSLGRPAGPADRLDIERGDRHDRRMRAGLGYFLLAMALVYPVKDIGAMLDQFSEGPLTYDVAALEGTALHDLRLHRTHDNMWVGQKPLGQEFLFVTNSTVRLRAAMAAQTCPGTVMTVGFSNPFPVIFGLPSPRNTPVWMDMFRTYSEENPIAPAVLLADSPWVVRSKDPHGIRAWRVYGDYVEAEYRLVADYAEGAIYTRCAPGEADPATAAAEGAS